MGKGRVVRDVGGGEGVNIKKGYTVNAKSGLLCPLYHLTLGTNVFTCVFRNTAVTRAGK